MTPLAYHIAKQKLLPGNERTFDDKGRVFDHILQAHCFECSDVVELACELKMQMPHHGTDARSTFLPAPKTWLEWRCHDGSRNGCLLLAEGDDFADRIEAIGNQGGIKDKYGLTGLSFSMGTRIPLKYKPVAKDSDAEYVRRRLVLAELGFDEHTLALLAIINTPRVVSRESNPAHRGLQRDARRRGFHEKIPDWNKIKLEINRPQTVGAGGRTDTITGGKALHFCRSFIRIKRGRLEIVKSHLRGNAVNGIKLSHYVVAA